MQNTGVAWKLLGWGLGEFQNCELVVVLKTLNGVSLIRSDGSVAVITQGEDIEVGFIVKNMLDESCSDGTAVGVLLNSFNMYKDRLQLSVDITDNDSNTIHRVVNPTNTGTGAANGDHHCSNVNGCFVDGGAISPPE